MMYNKKTNTKHIKYFKHDVVKLLPALTSTRYILHIYNVFIVSYDCYKKQYLPH